jgi:hypothetical protein
MHMVSAAMRVSVTSRNGESLYELAQQDLIALAMNELDLELTEFAERIGSKPTTVSKWLRQPAELSNYREMPGTVRQQIVDLLALVSLERKHEKLKIRYAALKGAT